MAKFSTYMFVMLIALTVIFTLSLIITDANVTGNYTNIDEFKTLNQTGQFAGNIQNQTEKMKTLLTKSNQAGADPLTLLNLLLQGGATVVVTATGLIGVGIALIFDFGGVIGIPAFFIGIAATGLMLLVIFQIVEGLRTGRM